MNNIGLFLRTCDKNMKAHGGFVWPVSGLVTAPDWIPNNDCGHGLHGLLWGKGDYSLLSRSVDAKWMVFEADTKTAIDLGQKHKVQTANVVYCGNSRGAIQYIIDRLLVNPSTTGNDAHASTTGDDAVSATLGYKGKAKANNGVLTMAYHDGKRRRIAVGYTGENIEANQWYYVNGKGEFVKTTV